MTTPTDIQRTELKEPRDNDGISKRIQDNQFEAVSKIFADKQVFQVDYVPNRILHRNEQIKSIQSILGDLNSGVRARNILCMGDFGTGKTAVVRSVCRDLPSTCKVVYVNCAEENTQSRIVRAILRQLGAPVKPGFPKDYYLQLLKDYVARHQYVILILDEVDKFVEKKDAESDGLFYTLSRSVNNVVAILLTNRVSFEAGLFASLDARVKDTFRFERVEFGDYCAPELSDILADRCRVGLNPETYDRAIIAMMAGISYRRGLRARGIIDLARKAAEIAEAKGHRRIEEEDARQASSELSHERELEVVQRLPPIHRAILAKALLDSPTGSTAYEWYRKIAPEYAVGSSLTTFHTYLRELETLGLLMKTKHGRGRGKGLEMRLTIPHEIANVVAKSLQADPNSWLTTSHPTAENVAG